jgi:hypothetical protein
MSDKLQAGIKAGSTDVSIGFALRKTTDSTEQTGKVASDMTVSYWRQGGSRTAISPSDLAAVNSAHSDGGVKEVDATNMPGVYRLDLPDAAVATGADWVMVSVKVASTFVYHERFALTTNVVQSADNATNISAIKTVTDQLVAAHSEPSGVPAADETPLDKLAYLFMALRNRLDVTASKKTFYDDGGNAEWEKDLSDDGTTYSETEANSV